MRVVFFPVSFYVILSRNKSLPAFRAISPPFQTRSNESNETGTESLQIGRDGAEGRQALAPGQDDTGKKTTRISCSSRAGMQFPVGRIHRYLKNMGTRRVSTNTAVYMAAVLEFLAADILEVAGNVIKEHKVKRIKPRHIQLTISGDTELQKLITATIPGGGVYPHIQKVLIDKFIKE
ncbi:histone H2A.V-like [Lolium rigidum]|uniref:histone H2A.V-like n=1 Tax=Lolium rigidum TaxID=89674 RepID=UPI001F5DEF16|nr:histone H2A.V-like [Lolium rigidum]